MEKKNYKQAKYTVELDLEKSPAFVFDRLIDLKKWWPEDFEGNDPKLNSEFTLSVGESHFSKNKVIKFIPGKAFTWITTESIRKTDGYDWSGTKMIFELAPNSNGTHLVFTYDGVVLDNESERLIQICDMCVKEMFYKYITTGIGKQS